MSQQTWAASAPGAAPVGLPASITVRTPGLHPPGIAWDPTRGAFLVSSMRRGTVSLVRPDGRTTEFIGETPDIVATVGLRVDAARGRLLAVYADAGFAERSGPTTSFRTTGVAVFDLATAERRHLVELGETTLGANLVNDLTFDDEGNVYATDTPNDGILRIDPDGRPSVLRTGARVTPRNVGFMGVMWHPDGFLLTVRHDDGGLYRVPLNDPAAMEEVALDRALVGGAALALRADGSVAAVTNTLIGPGKDGVSVLESGDGWRSARTVRRVEPWPDPAPTGVTVTPFGTYVVSGRPDRLVGGEGVWDQFSLRRL
ncbi:SMP-30/gluconolactonase/LRE family protein [Streptomyces sp. CB03234]|uniref:SMP-30/gluconolactonase/LRE family protein n=1 Tax=Streptomyces sp. (strain CB03234) TaxID=1703937 RepID=UPI0009A19811|nr:SMP-30/gluconolactonase/LRE family protein [Streptomyces sp. CB03234]